MGGNFLKSADFLEDIYIYSPGSERDFLGDIYIPQEVELLPEEYKYCPEIRSGMGYIPLAVPLILELPELQKLLLLKSIKFVQQYNVSLTIFISCTVDA